MDLANAHLELKSKNEITVEPVLSGTVLSGQLSKSRKLLSPLLTVILTPIELSPLLSGRLAIPEGSPLNTGSTVLTIRHHIMSKKKLIKQVAYRTGVIFLRFTGERGQSRGEREVRDTRDGRGPSALQDVLQAIKQEENGH